MERTAEEISKLEQLLKRVSAEYQRNTSSKFSIPYGERKEATGSLLRLTSGELKLLLEAARDGYVGIEMLLADLSQAPN